MFPTDPHDPIYGIYAMLFQLSLIGVGTVIAFSIAWSVTTSEAPKAVVASIKDAVLALLLALLAPYIYNATASIINTVSVGIVGQGYAVQAMAVGIYATAIALGAALGLFLPYLAHLAATATILMLIGNIILVIRWALILAIVAASPLLALAYIHPALRGAARRVVGVLAGLVLAGPIAAIALIVIGKMVGDIAAAIAFPIFVQIVPPLLGIFEGGAAVGLGFHAFEGIGRVVSRGATTLATATGRAGGRIRLPMPRSTTPRMPTERARVAVATAPATREVPFRPIITRESIAKAKEKAETALVSKVYEAADREERMGLGMSYVLEGREGVVEHAKRLAPDHGIKPRWETFKEAVKELTKRAARQYWTNLREGLKEFGAGLLHEAKIKIPRGYGGSAEWVGMYPGVHGAEDVYV
jgi:hypothetical protein